MMTIVEVNLLFFRLVGSEYHQVTSGRDLWGSMQFNKSLQAGTVLHYGWADSCSPGMKHVPSGFHNSRQKTPLLRVINQILTRSPYSLITQETMCDA